MTTAMDDLLTKLSCGHAARPSFYNGDVTIMRDDGSTYQHRATGVSFPGYATIGDGRRVCLDCADDMQRADMVTARRFTAYLSSDNRTVTTWTGGRLATVTRCTSNDRQTFIRARDVHGNMWAGIGPAESGTYVSLRRVKS